MGVTEMKRKLGCFLPVMLGLLALLATGVRADEVKVTMSITVTGASVCGPSGTSPCVDTLDGSFIWNNTTDSASNISVTITGPIDYGTLTVSGPVSFPPNNAIEAKFADAGGDYATFGIFYSDSNLTPGTYTYTTSFPAPGEFGGTGKCVTELCFMDFPKGTTFSGTVTVTAVVPTPTPEPGTVLLLFVGLGLLGFAVADRQVRSRAA